MVNTQSTLLKMAMIYSIILSCILMSILLVNNGHAISSVYSDCVFSWDFGETNKKLIIVRPVGNICYKRCTNECNSFTRDRSGNKIASTDSYREMDAQQDLNRDIVERCMTACQAGKIFTSQYREINPDKTSLQPFIWKPAVTTQTYCSTGASIDSADYAYYSSGLIVDPTRGEKIIITLLNPNNAIGNILYLCGFGTVRYDPVFASLIPADWQTPEALSTYYYDHHIDGHSLDSWHARNKSWVESGIDIIDGDYLAITYGGNYFNKCTDTDCPSASSINDIQVWIPRTGDFRFDDPSTTSSTIPGSQLQSPQLSDDGKGNLGYDNIKNPDTIMNANRKISWFGLGKEHTASIRIENKPLRPGIPTWIKSIVGDKNNSKVLPNEQKELYRVHNFFGILSGLSTRYTRLAFSHIFSGTAKQGLTNLGGMNVNVTWRGCVYKNGERLQYALVPQEKNGDETIYNPEGSNVQWIDLKQNELDGTKELTPQGSQLGQIFFRIKVLEPTYTEDNGLTPICQYSDSFPCNDSIRKTTGLQKYGRANTAGQYTLSIEKPTKPSAVSGAVSSLINKITDYFFTENSNPQNGIVPKIFKQFVSGSGLVKSIRVLLVLYIAYTGLVFIVGLANITQLEALIRIFKLAIITVLISDQSWDFFNTYLFQTFRGGSLELIAKITSSMYVGAYNEHLIMNDPSQIFSVFDRPFEQLFSQAVWLKILAVFLSNLVGVVLAIAIIFAAIMYAICIGKCILLYLISIIALGVLFLVAPIFISFILFGYTKPIFDSWLKMMLSFAMQPVFAFTAVAVLNNLVLAGLYTTLAFTACKMCLFGLVIPGILDICIIPGWITLATAHTPPTDPIGLPIATISSAIFFLIMGQAMNLFCSFCSNLANTIVTGSFVGMDLSSMTPGNPITAIGGYITSILGIDKESTAMRRNISSSNSSNDKSDKSNKSDKSGGKSDSKVRSNLTENVDNRHTIMNINKDDNIDADIIINENSSNSVSDEHTSDNNDRPTTNA